MLVQVQPRHIQAGHRGIPDECPIALALRDQLGCDTIVDVGAVFIYILKTGGRPTQYILPYIARNFVLDFDAGHPVKPIAFMLDKR